MPEHTEVAPTGMSFPLGENSRGSRSLSDNRRRNNLENSSIYFLFFCSELLQTEIEDEFLRDPT